MFNLVDDDFIAKTFIQLYHFLIKICIVMEWKWIIIITTKYVVKFALWYDPSNVVEFILKNNIAESSFTAGKFVSISDLSGETY